MRHRASSKFWNFFNKLPRNVQELADKSFELLKADPHHPSLHFKKVGRFWSARVGRQYRALAVEESGDLVWFWIGHHSEYDDLIGGR